MRIDYLDTPFSMQGGHTTFKYSGFVCVVPSEGQRLLLSRVSTSPIVALVENRIHAECRQMLSPTKPRGRWFQWRTMWRVSTRRLSPAIRLEGVGTLSFLPVSFLKCTRFRIWNWGPKKNGSVQSRVDEESCGASRLPFDTKAFLDGRSHCVEGRCVPRGIGTCVRTPQNRDGCNRSTQGEWHKKGSETSSSKTDPHPHDAERHALPTLEIRSGYAPRHCDMKTMEWSTLRQSED